MTKRRKYPKRKWLPQKPNHPWILQGTAMRDEAERKKAEAEKPSTVYENKYKYVRDIMK